MRRTVVVLASMASAMLLAGVVSGEARLRRPWIVLLAAILLCLVAGITAAERQPLAQERPQKPNILFILTDDQTTEDLTNMAKARSLLVKQGTSFSNAFATKPQCCPSRVSFMRGQYVHNHRVVDNKGAGGGYKRFIKLGLQRSTVATWLDDAGYATFFAGEFLNGYKNTRDMPPGWDNWYAFIGKVHLGDYEVNENGKLRTYRQADKHETYYLRDKAEAFVRNHKSGAPWFAWVSTHAPHGPYTIALPFRHSFDDAKMPRPPSYNEADVSDKPQWIRRLPRVDSNCSTEEPFLDCQRQVVEQWRARQEALMSVDVMVKDLVSALAQTNQLNHTSPPDEKEWRV